MTDSHPRGDGVRVHDNIWRDPEVREGHVLLPQVNERALGRCERWKAIGSAIVESSKGLTRYFTVHTVGC